jgi:pimeloyl-ACP methyl ester carboxylesterase
MGRTRAPATMRSASDVLDVLLGVVDAVAGSAPLRLVGHSAGAYFAQAIATRRPDRIAGLALVCPLATRPRDLPEHRPVVGDGTLGDETFRDYFVVQTPEMLDRYERFVAPAAALVDAPAMERIGSRWELDTSGACSGPALVVAGRQDSVVGSVAAVDLLEQYPAATLAVLDRAGHALPHEQPAVLAALLDEWLGRT